MRVHVAVVGKVRSPLEAAVSEYEARASRYWKLTVTEVDAGTRGKGGRRIPSRSGRRRVSDSGARSPRPAGWWPSPGKAGP